MIRDLKFLIIMISIQQFQYELYCVTLYLPWYKDILWASCNIMFAWCILLVQNILFANITWSAIFSVGLKLCVRGFQVCLISTVAYFTMSYMTLIKSGPILSNFLNPSQLIRSLYILSLSAPVLSVCEFENSD